MWSKKRELVKHSAALAKEKHPDGFNKSQLVECSKEVFGGYSTNPNKEVKTHEDVNNMANHMSEIDGGYPRGMSTCFVVGINGGCGASCPAFIDGDCGEPQEFNPEYIVSELGLEEGIEAMYGYRCFDEYVELNTPAENVEGSAK